jgi:hypothetical protein
LVRVGLWSAVCAPKTFSIGTWRCASLQIRPAAAKLLCPLPILGKLGEILILAQRISPAKLPSKGDKPSNLGAENSFSLVFRGNVSFRLRPSLPRGPLRRRPRARRAGPAARAPGPVRRRRVRARRCVDLPGRLPDSSGYVRHRLLPAKHPTDCTVGRWSNELLPGECASRAGVSGRLR